VIEAGVRRTDQGEIIEDEASRINDKLLDLGTECPIFAEEEKT
jgi:hypothetical protein